MDRWKRHSSERAPGGLNHESATCVQRFDDSLIPAIHTTYRISLRSSSSREPRYPLLGVVIIIILIIRLCCANIIYTHNAHTHAFTHVYACIYVVLFNALAAVLEFVYIYILYGSTSTLCVVCMCLS